MCGGFDFMKNIHEKYMKMAINEAKKAALIDEVPIGCVIVKNEKVIARGHNLRETKNDPTCHAEIVAIRKASKKLNDWQLVDCDLYVTIEPCIMCSGAIIQSRISKVIFGSRDPKGGALVSSINVLEASNINHKPEVIEGVLKEECSEIVKKYFKNKRETNK